MTIFEWITYAITALLILSFTGQVYTVIMAGRSQEKLRLDKESEKRIQQILLPLMNYSEGALKSIGNPFKSFSVIQVSKVITSHLELISGEKRFEMFAFFEECGFLDIAREKLKKTRSFQDKVTFLKLLSLSPHPEGRNLNRDAEIFRHHAQSEDNAVAITACFALAKLDKQVYLKELVEILRARKKCSWLYIAQAMKLSSKSFPKCMDYFTAHPSPKVRKACVSTIKYISNPINPKILNQLILDSTNEQVCFQALNTLVFLRHKIEYEVLGKAFNAKSKELRLLAIQCVQQSGSKMMIIPLMEGLYSSDWDISYHSALAILSIGGQGKMLLENLISDHTDSSAASTALLVLKERGLLGG